MSNRLSTPDERQLSSLRTSLTRICRRVHAKSSGSDFTQTEMFLLARVDNLGPTSVKDLLALDGLNATMLSRIIKRLSDAGLVRCEPVVPDRRAVRVAATGKGRAVHRRRCEDRNQVLSVAIAELEPEHAGHLLAALPALERLSHILGAE